MDVDPLADQGGLLAAAVPATAQAWTAGTASGTLTVQADALPNGNHFGVGYVAATHPFYEVWHGWSDDVQVPGTCVKSSRPRTARCQDDGITEIVFIGGPSEDALESERRAYGSPAPYPDGVLTTAYGNGQKDLLVGSHLPDLLFGGGARDALIGGRRHDKLVGQAGADVLFGGEGRDKLKARDGVADQRIDCGPDPDRAPTLDVGLDPDPIDC